jgi:signal transduction histidine kinase
MGDKQTRADNTTAEVLDSLPDAVFLLDDGIVAELNRAARDMLAGHDEILGRPLGDFLAAGELERFSLLDAQRGLGWALPEAHRMRFVRPDGNLLMADVRWRRPTPSRVVLTARDVSDVTRAEALMGQLARLPIGLDGADAFLNASESVFAALGWTIAFVEIVEGGSITHRMIAAPGDPVGEYGRSLLGRLIPRSDTPVLAQVVATGEPLFLDNLPTTAHGLARQAVALSESMTRARVVRSAWCPIGGTRVTHLLAVTGRDLTEHDFVVIQLFAAQVGAALRLEALRVEMVQRERLAAVGAMAATLAHEVRNPLGIIFNAIGGLRRTLPDATGDARELLLILEQEADRLKHLVTNLLEFASPHASVREVVTLAPVIAEVVRAASYDDSFARSEPTLRIDVPGTLAAKTDAVLLRRALLNLLVNAFQHVTPGGRVTIEAKRAQRGQLTLSVSNDGPLPCDAVRNRMFEPFFTTKPTGTGLGLAIVQRLADDIQARVAYVPGPDGATFVLELPEAAPES